MALGGQGRGSGLGGQSTASLIRRKEARKRYDLPNPRLQLEDVHFLMGLGYGENQPATKS